MVQSLVACQHPCGGKHPGENSSSLQHSCLAQTEHLILTLFSSAFKQYLACPLCSLFHNKLVSLVCKCIAADLRQALLWMVLVWLRRTLLPWKDVSTPTTKHLHETLHWLHRFANDLPHWLKQSVHLAYPLPEQHQPVLKKQFGGIICFIFTEIRQ